MEGAVENTDVTRAHTDGQISNVDATDIDKGSLGCGKGNNIISDTAISRHDRHFEVSNGNDKENGKSSMAGGVSTKGNTVTNGNVESMTAGMYQVDNSNNNALEPSVKQMVDNKWTEEGFHTETVDTESSKNILEEETEIYQPLLMQNDLVFEQRIKPFLVQEEDIYDRGHSLVTPIDQTEYRGDATVLTLDDNTGQPRESDTDAVELDDTFRSEVYTCKTYRSIGDLNYVREVAFVPIEPVKVPHVTVKPLQESDSAEEDVSDSDIKLDISDEERSLTTAAGTLGKPDDKTKEGSSKGNQEAQEVANIFPAFYDNSGSVDYKKENKAILKNVKQNHKGAKNYKTVDKSNRYFDSNHPAQALIDQQSSEDSGFSGVHQQSGEDSINDAVDYKLFDSDSSEYEFNRQCTLSQDDKSHLPTLQTTIEDFQISTTGVRFSKINKGFNMTDETEKITLPRKVHFVNKKKPNLSRLKNAAWNLETSFDDEARGKLKNTPNIVTRQFFSRRSLSQEDLHSRMMTELRAKRRHTVCEALPGLRQREKFKHVMKELKQKANQHEQDLMVGQQDLVTLFIYPVFILSNLELSSTSYFFILSNLFAKEYSSTRFFFSFFQTCLHRNFLPLAIF